MDDATTLVAIVGGGEVTPIHLIIYVEKKSIRLSRIVASEHSRVCTFRLGFSLARRSAIAGLIKTTLSNRNAST